jgi:hypothetical protein
MIERGEGLRFTLESGETFGIGCEKVWQDLDGDVSIEPRIARAIDLL